MHRVIESILCACHNALDVTKHVQALIGHRGNQQIKDRENGMCGLYQTSIMIPKKS